MGISLDIANSIYKNYNLVLPEVISLYFSLITFFIMYLLYKKNKDILLKSIDIILFISTSFFFFQLLMYKIFGTYLDPIGLISGIPARNYFESGGMSFLRVTGLTVEPGTYGTYSMVLLYSSYLLKPQIRKLHLYVMLSMILTFSVFSLIFVIGYVSVVFKERIRKHPYGSLFIFSLLLFILYVSFNDYIIYRFFSDNEDGSLRTKLYAFYFLYDADLNRILSGSGFSHNDCYCLIADTTMFFSIFYNFGIAAIIIFILFFYSIRKNLNAIILSIFFFLSKMLLFFPLFWIFILSIYITINERKEIAK